MKRRFQIRHRAAWRACVRRLCSLALIFSLAAIPARPQTTPVDGKPTEYEVEAAYLSNFGRFVEWPRPVAAGENFDLCVLGQDPFGPLLDSALKGESIGGDSLVARRITSVENARSCRVLFISRSSEGHLAEILQEVRLLNLLTVSDIAGFTRRGGIIEFVLQEKKVRFEINIAAAKRAGLTLSSQLLKIATSVRRTP